MIAVFAIGVPVWFALALAAALTLGPWLRRARLAREAADAQWAAQQDTGGEQ